MHPLFIGTPEVLIVLVIAAIVIFGGSRLAGVGKGAGKAIREFKEETEGFNKPKTADAIPAQPGMPGYPVEGQAQQVIIPQQPPAPQPGYVAPQQPYATQAPAQQPYVAQAPAQPYGGASVAQPAGQAGLGAPVEQQAQQPYQAQPPAATDAGLINPERPGEPQA